MNKIALKGQIVEYELQRKSVKNINLRIKPDGSVYVSANDKILQKNIDEFLIEKSDFILRTLEQYKELQRYAPKPKEYIDGESFRICGHDRRLKVVKGSENHVQSDESYIILTVKDIDDIELKKSIMDKWLKEQCIATVSLICDTVYTKFQKYGVDYPTLKFRKMISRWGSCQPKRGILTFNISLVEAPIACIEYVVVHEFTHFLQPNHSKRFYTQLAMFMPDWNERKKLLEKSGIGTL